MRRGLYEEYYPEDRDDKFWPHIRKSYRHSTH
jgi:hypothetical protein